MLKCNRLEKLKMLTIILENRQKFHQLQSQLMTIQEDKKDMENFQILLVKIKRRLANKNKNMKK